MNDVRPARPGDAEGMARVHVQAWQETYRGVMPDAVLDDPEAPARRQRMWEAVLTDDRYAANTVAVAERDGRIVGIAMAGPPRDEAADGSGRKGARELHVLYVLAAHHGTGLGRRVLQAAIPDGTAATLWVADPNPRAQAFYRAAGFVPDGVTKVEEGVRHLHLARPAATRRAARPEGTDGATA
jgi:GNAT superfamily N-acetyltransferase